jgi:hypothetical protein
VLGDVMTQETYCVKRERVDKDEKKKMKTRRRRV